MPHELIVQPPQLRSRYKRRTATVRRLTTPGEREPLVFFVLGTTFSDTDH
jgi:hypothetical protein